MHIRMMWLNTVAILILSLAFSLGPVTSVFAGPVVSTAVTAAKTGPLSAMPTAPVVAPQPGAKREISANRPIPRAGMSTRRPDPSSIFNDPGLGLPLPIGPSALQAILSFDGLSNADNSTVIGGRVAPPDTDGAVGPNHYVQMVNLIFAVYDKNTGALLGGPWPNNQPWIAANTNDACEDTNDGDPIVLYDQLANRWLISQFALPNFPNGPFYECIAVSQTADPLGSWYVYTFKISDTKMNDYPKIGVWPDGYYMSVNQFDATNALNWAGTGVAAFERSAMLAGSASPKMVYFDNASDQIGGLLPSNLQGTTTPAAGTPNYFVQMADDAWGFPADFLQVWEFHVDWATPANSTFTQKVALPTAPFDSTLCDYSRDCIPQPGTTQRVDAISDRLMNLLQYRRFTNHQSMVVNHTVDVGGDHAGIRWYELRNTGSGWSIYQQGDYAPDSDHRWMGSIALDSQGNILLGYSKSSSTTYPSVGYTGRLAGDPLNSMTQGENPLVNGGGSQLGVNRWGDYSAMVVDPNDDCVFWYTQEYVKATGNWNWDTRIGAAKIPSCGVTLGSLIGTVTGNSAPLSGAQVTVAGGASTTTDASGHYAFNQVLAGSYAMTVKKYGFNDGSASGVTVTNGNTTTQNFTLTAKSMATVSGAVTDAATGLPLASATITIPEYPVWPVTTNASGQYSVQLEYGTVHHLTASATGYLNSSAVTLTPATPAITQNFALNVDGVACNAPHYVKLNALAQDFNGATFPPTGWTVVDNAGTGVVWKLNTAWGDGNYTGGTGTAADANSDKNQGIEYDTELVSPVISVASLPPSPKLLYRANFQKYSTEYLKVDIKVDGGTWTNLLSWQEDHGGFEGLPGEQVLIDLTPHVTGHANFQLRWHYYNPNTDDWDWYAQVDDVRVGACVPSGSIFADVPQTYWAVDWIARLYAAGVTGGCATNPLRYCPDNNVKRSEMAVFLLRGEHTGTYTPPVATTAPFTDVPLSYWAVNWIKQLAVEGITTGCNPPTNTQYCPENNVTRAEMAVFLVRTFDLP